MPKTSKESWKTKLLNSALFNWILFLTIYIFLVYALVKNWFEGNIIKIFITGFFLLFMNAVLFYGEKIKNFVYENYP
jgi:hypothetical protein